jgi:hypothetical protein
MNLHGLTCKCKKHGKRFCWSCGWFTVGFPIEHFIWERIPPFKFVLPLLGLH